MAADFRRRRVERDRVNPALLNQGEKLECTCDLVPLVIKGRLKLLHQISLTKKESDGTAEVLDLSALLMSDASILEDALLLYSPFLNGVLVSVDLSNNDLSMLPAGLFEHLPMMCSLNVSHNLLVDIPVRIEQCHHLRSLNLSFNLLERFPLALSTMSYLTNLNVDSNQLSTLPSLALLRGLQSLKWFTFANNKIEALDDNINALKWVTRMDASSNHLSSLSDDWGQLSRLQILNLAANSVSYVPDALFGLKNLLELDLSHNFVDSLPETADDGVNPSVLLAAHNKLERLPEVLGEFTNLTFLSVEYNDLVALPPALIDCQKIEFLGLANNAFSKFPPVICELKELRELYFGNNPLHDLPPELIQLEKLEIADFSFNGRKGRHCAPANQIDLIPECWKQFSGKALKVLHLEGNTWISNVPSPVLNRGIAAIWEYLANVGEAKLRALEAGLLYKPSKKLKSRNKVKTSSTQSIHITKSSRWLRYNTPRTILAATEFQRRPDAFLDVVPMVQPPLRSEEELKKEDFRSRLSKLSKKKRKKGR
jgi:Leucine-rich repeat (LRR) protein